MMKYTHYNKRYALTILTAMLMCLSVILSACTPVQAPPETSEPTKPTTATMATTTPATTAPAPTDTTEATTPPTAPPTTPPTTATAPHEHVYTSETEVPTCSEPGHTVYTCECGDSYTEGSEAPLGHEYSDWVTTVAPTVENEGVLEKVCSRCGDKVTSELPKLIPAGHTHVYVETRQEPTCTEYGYIDRICECGKTESSWGVGETIEPLGHAYGDWVVTKEPTTSSGGERHRSCSRCGLVHEDYMAPLDAETGEQYASYIDPRITINSTPTATSYDYRESQCRLGDARTWGETPSIYIEADGSLRVVYFLQDGTMRTEVITPMENYYSMGIIYDSGEFTLKRIGKVS